MTERHDNLKQIFETEYVLAADAVGFLGLRAEKDYETLAGNLHLTDTLAKKKNPFVICPRFF